MWGERRRYHVSAGRGCAQDPLPPELVQQLVDADNPRLATRGSPPGIARPSPPKVLDHPRHQPESTSRDAERGRAPPPLHEDDESRRRPRLVPTWWQTPRKGCFPACSEGRAEASPNLWCMYTLGLDTIAGSKLLQIRFGRSASFQPDQAVMHGDQRARFIRASDGTAIIRDWGSRSPVAVPLEALSLPPAKEDHAALSASAGADARQAGSLPRRSRLSVRAGMRGAGRHHLHRRPLLRP